MFYLTTHYLWLYGVRYIYIYIYFTGVGSGGGGGGGEGQGGHVPPHFFDWGGNSMFVPLHF